MQLRRCANRGGNWNNGTDNGVFALNFNNPRSNVNTNIGGRPALLLGWTGVFILTGLNRCQK